MKQLILAGIGLAALASAATSPADDGGRKLSTVLSGSVEVPGPGDLDGSGSFVAEVNPGQGSICYRLQAHAIVTATGAHIHRAPVGSAGPVVVPLSTPANGSAEACAEISRELAMQLIQNPQDFYVNVHNSEFPAGAIRGQLQKGK